MVSMRACAPPSAGPNWRKDERFASNGARVRNKAELTPVLERLFAGDTRARWIERLMNANVPCGPINTIAEVFAEPQVRHRGMSRELPHPVSGTVPQVASPLRFGGVAALAERAPPALGADTDTVLASIGVTRDQLAALRARGIV